VISSAQFLVSDRCTDVTTLTKAAACKSWLRFY